MTSQIPEQTSQIEQTVIRKKPPNAGKGRGKGALNMSTRLLRDAIIEAGERAGGKYGNDGLVSYLEKQAVRCPHAFLSLLGKVLPIQLTGQNGGAIHIVQNVKISYLDDDRERN
ncbi:hypothetical protein [Bartonella rattaustraliani]|uniref:hypothetical protein n=1 Tax=Bartonella rattaustraliani TaxID=481139 RepID=UPI0002D65270|nr:hypothetical protein [Bartonella rattaustraliani]